MCSHTKDENGGNQTYHIIFSLTCLLTITIIGLFEVVTHDLKIISVSRHASNLSLDNAYSTSVQPVDCLALFNGEVSEVSRILQSEKDVPLLKKGLSYWMDITRDCGIFRDNQGYIQEPVTPEEAEFPLAFSILFYRDVEQVEQLLRAVYRPQNYYCLHMDTKFQKDVYSNASINLIVNCLPNVFMSSVSYDVRWGTISILQAEMACMKDLHRHKDWKYFINLTGQEYPLKTNLDIVRILKSLNGRSAAAGRPFAE